MRIRYEYDTSSSFARIEPSIFGFVNCLLIDELASAIIINCFWRRPRCEDWEHEIETQAQCLRAHNMNPKETDKAELKPGWAAKSRVTCLTARYFYHNFRNPSSRHAENIVDSICLLNCWSCYGEQSDKIPWTYQWLEHQRAAAAKLAARGKRR